MIFYKKDIVLLILIFCGCIINSIFSSAQSYYEISSTHIMIDPGENTDSIMRSNMFVSVTANKKTVFIGEPVMVIYKFYTAISSASTVAKQPQFNGCSVQELDYNGDASQETLNGKNYNVFVVRKVQLTPLQEGVLQLGQVFVDNVVEFTSLKDPFKTEKYSLTLTNKTQSVTIVPLPQKNRPSEFSGITGNFSLDTKVNSNHIPVNESGHLIITIHGIGNLQSINQPAINWPDDIEHFDATDTQHINQSNFPISGDKVFDILYVGKHEGNVMLPPVSFTFFNTETQNYSTIHSDSIPVTFTKAIAQNKMFACITKKDVSNRKYLWIVATLAGALSLIFFIDFKRRKNTKGETMQQSKIPCVEEMAVPVMAKTQKTNFEQALNDLKYSEHNKDYFIKAKGILAAAIAENIVISTSAENPHTLKQPRNNDLKLEIETFYQACDAALYSPIEIENNYEFLTHQLQSLIKRVQISELSDI